MDTLVRIGMDTAKNVFQLHGVDVAEAVVLRRQLRLREMVKFFGKLRPTLVAIEAYASSHHWARLLQSFGHEVKLIPPQYVRPYVKRGKNDAADAEALCEAISRPLMRFVPVKSREQQAACMLMTVRDLFRLQAQEYVRVMARLTEVDAKLMTWHRTDDLSRRIANIPGVGPTDQPCSARRLGQQGFPIRSPVCRMAGTHAERSFDRREGPTRCHHQGRISGDPLNAYRWSNSIAASR